MKHLLSKLVGGKRKASANPPDLAKQPADSPEADQASHAADTAIEQAFKMGRYGIIVAQAGRWAGRPKIDAARRAAEEAIDEQFCIVPEGYASIPTTINDQPGCPEDDYEVQPFLLARHALTNAEFQNFVDSAAYQDMDLWPEDIMAQLIHFHDLTREPGPRFWKNGRHDPKLANHPVVGITFYEASAYAHWAGFRMPTEAEWQMAASWRIRTTTNNVWRYPWGDTLDRDRCNTWASGHGRTLPVDACPDGAAPNGVMQLIGNVWEWTSSDFTSVDDRGWAIIGATLMKSIRGGAYDTYFPTQATSLFRSASESTARPGNIGVRCAMDLPSADHRAGGSPGA